MNGESGVDFKDKLLVCILRYLISSFSNILLLSLLLSLYYSFRQISYNPPPPSSICHPFYCPYISILRLLQPPHFSPSEAASITNTRTESILIRVSCTEYQADFLYALGQSWLLGLLFFFYHIFSAPVAGNPLTTSVLGRIIIFFLLILCRFYTFSETYVGVKIVQTGH